MDIKQRKSCKLYGYSFMEIGNNRQSLNRKLTKFWMNIEKFHKKMTQTYKRLPTFKCTKNIRNRSRINKIIDEHHWNMKNATTDLRFLAESILLVVEYLT